eukprot:4982807-Amphidinium_carterae.1
MSLQARSHLWLTRSCVTEAYVEHRHTKEGRLASSFVFPLRARPYADIPACMQQYLLESTKALEAPM